MDYGETIDGHIEDFSDFLRLLFLSVTSLYSPGGLSNMTTIDLSFPTTDALSSLLFIAISVCTFAFEFEFRIQIQIFKNTHSGTA